MRRYACDGMSLPLINLYRDTENGLLFGVYHLSQPWTILGSSIVGAFFFALPTRRYRCAWFGILAHSGQSVYFLVLILGLVLGLA